MTRGTAIVTLTTDFGLSDAYVGAMKGVLLSRCPEVQIVDICHEAPPQNVRAGAMRLASAAPYFPAGTVHIAIVDPGVGGLRRGLAIACSAQFFVGPDNGVLSLAAPRDGAGWRGVELANPEVWLPRVSATFHGRDVFAPAAAHLAIGGDLRSLGPSVETIVALGLPRPSRSGDRIAGRVLDVDRFGNIVTNVQERDMAGGKVRSVELGGAAIEGLSTWYDPTRLLVALINSDGWLEVAKPGGSAAAHLRVGPESPVEVRIETGGHQQGKR